MEPQSNQTKILQVYNPFDAGDPITYLSLAIRVFTCSKWNHAAILKDNMVYEMVGSGLLQTPYDEWLTSKDRTVRVYNSNVPIEVPFQTAYDIIGGSHVRYGFLDILQIAKHLIRTKWFGKLDNWDGRKGTRLWTGIICSELVGLALRRKDAHLIIPSEIGYLPELVFEREFKTYKKLGKRYGFQ